MKQLLISFFIIGLLATTAVAEMTSNAETTNSAPPYSAAQQPSTNNSRAMRSQTNAQKNEGTIVVDVWSSADQEEESLRKLSPSFAVAGLTAASRMQNTERRMEQSIKRGFPLGEFWIRLDFDGIDDSLRFASLAATNDADRQALEQLESQTTRLRSWSDWLIQQNRQLRLANYYISPDPLDNDEQFQGTVACTNYLLSMLSHGRLEEEDRSCR